MENLALPVSDNSLRREKVYFNVPLKLNFSIFSKVSIPSLSESRLSGDRIQDDFIDF